MPVAQNRQRGRNLNHQTSRLLATILLLLTALPLCAQVDLALIGGRVMDPETGLDATRNVGIRGDRIVEITELPIAAVRSIDVSGLIVAPGFIDLHAHGQTNAANEYQARDGVTSALELESGIYPLTGIAPRQRDRQFWRHRFPLCGKGAGDADIRVEIHAIATPSRPGK